MTLRKVAERAMQDRDFFQALLDDPKAALHLVGWALDRSDMRVLTRALKGKPVAVDFNAVKFIQEMLDHPECLDPWKVTWRIDPPPLK